MRIILAVISALAAAGNAGAQAAPAATSPSLVVLITIDGFPANNFDRFGTQLTGGLARIRDRGAWFTDAHHDHAITETAPGHASLLSGRFPASTGIAANRVGVSDPRSPLLGGSGALGASPERFQGSTLFDWLKKKHPRARALSVSAKDRGAILPLGRAKESVFWYPGDGAFTTSSYYADSLPGWVTRFNERQLPQQYAGRAWTLVADESAYASPDSVEIEGAGNNFMFPHMIPDDPQRAANWIRGTPFIDEVTVAFALEGAAAMQLGKGSHPDLLAVSLSGTDAINHRLGPDSREAQDQVLRTDHLLGVMLDSLYRLVDSSRVIVVFTADHGFTPIPELAARTVEPMPTRTNLDDALTIARAKATELKVDSSAIDVDQQIFLMDRRAFSRARGGPEAVMAAFETAAKETWGVHRVDRLKALHSAGPGDDPIARRWRHQFGPESNVELVATLTPGSLWTSLLVASHGSPYDADSHVPVIFLGPGFKPGRYGAFVRTVDIAPTLARVLKLQPSEKIDGVPLTAALR
ncbi:MAG: alkaline phosphatase family protein [Gemmatimonadaceae bacterium]